MTDDELQAIRERLEVFRATDPDPLSNNFDDAAIGAFYDNAEADIAALLAEVEQLQQRCEQLYYDGLEE